MKVLITGISGFLGGYLAERLLADGHEVAGFVRQSNRLNHPTYQRLLGRAQMYYGSLTDYQAVRQCVKDFQPDVVFGLGAITPVSYSFDHPQEVGEANYIGTINLVEACVREVPSLRKMIQASSMETYGFLDKREAFVETDEQRPAAPYAVAKVAAEKYVQYAHYAYQFPGIGIRQTNAFGRKDNHFFICERIISQMLEGDVCNLGDPRPVRNFIFVEDLVDFYVALMHSGQETNGQVFNTGPDNGLTIFELAEMIRKKLNWRGTINWHTRPVRPGEIFYLNSSAEKAKQLLNWEPKVSLDEGLDRTIAIWKKNLGIVDQPNLGTAYLDQLDQMGCVR